MALRIGIIGAGTISQSVHIPLVRRAHLELAWVCDLSPTRARDVGESSGVPFTTDPGDVLADPAVDAVLIATPGSHADLAVQALQAGKHVLAEKPLALCLADVDRIEAAATQAGRIIQVGYMKMYDPLTAQAAAQLAGLTQTRLVRVTVSHPADEPQIAHLRMGEPPRDADLEVIQAAEQRDIDASARALTGAPPAVLAYYRNVLHGSVIHELSLLRAVGLPLPHRWTAEAFPELGEKAPACLLATGAVGAARYILSWNWLPDYPEYDEELKVLAANGRLTYQLARPYLLEDRSRLTVENHVDLQRRTTAFTDTYETGFLRQLDAFAASITTGAPVVADLAGARQDIRQTQLLAQAIAASAGVSISIEEELHP